MTFKFFIGGFFGGHFETCLQDEKLLFFVSNLPMGVDIETDIPNYTVSIKNDPDWQGLLRFIKALNWKPEYESDILDGEQWTLAFEDGNFTLDCYGNNAYPADFDEFTRLLRVITKKHNIPFD